MLLVLCIWWRQLGTVPICRRLVMLGEELAFLGIMCYTIYYIYSCGVTTPASRDWVVAVKALSYCTAALYPCIGVSNYIYSNARLYRKLSRMHSCEAFPGNILTELNSTVAPVLPSYTKLRFVYLFRTLPGTLGTHLLMYYKLGWNVEKIARFYGISVEKETETLYYAMGKLQSAHNLYRLYHSGIILR